MSSAFTDEQPGEAEIIARDHARSRAVAAAAGAAALVVLLAGALAVVLGPAGSPQAAQASAACERAVVADWKRDGRVDGVHPLSCYRRALAQLPADVRDYSDAPTEIERALAIASNHPARAARARDATASNDGAPPLVLAAVGGLVLLVAALGAAALLRTTRARRRPAS
jgi:hypothetical protein